MGFEIESSRSAWRSPWTWLIIVWIGIVATTPIVAIEMLAIEAVVLCFAAGFLGINPKSFPRKWTGWALTVFFLALFVAIGHPARKEIGLSALIAGLMLRSGILLTTLVILVEKLGQFGMLSALASLGLPRELISTIRMMARYGPVLSDQNRRMKRARQSRMVRRSLPGTWLLQSGGLSTLLSSSLKRSDRIHAAMLARGWQSSGMAIQSNNTRDEHSRDFERVVRDAVASPAANPK
jgi:cobalt/nickel transport system permease protein